MMNHVPRKEANATGINLVSHSIHHDGWLLPPRSTISATCNVDHLMPKTYHNVQCHSLTAKGVIIATAATITSNNANYINAQAIGMIGQHGPWWFCVVVLWLCVCRMMCQVTRREENTTSATLM
jgi:hypothetical protein